MDAIIKYFLFTALGLVLLIGPILIVVLLVKAKKRKK
jgi:hypothetical protein